MAYGTVMFKIQNWSKWGTTKGQVTADVYKALELAKNGKLRLSQQEIMVLMTQGFY